MARDRFEIHNDVTPEQTGLKVGDPVSYLRDLGNTTSHSVDRCEPFRDINGLWVVFLTGVSGYVALCRVRKRAVTLQTLLADAMCNRAQIADLFADVALWNEARPEAPMEADPDGSLGRLAVALDKLVVDLEARIEAEGPTDAA